MWLSSSNRKTFSNVTNLKQTLTFPMNRKFSSNLTTRVCQVIPTVEITCLPSTPVIYQRRFCSAVSLSISIAHEALSRKTNGTSGLTSSSGHWNDFPAKQIHNQAYQTWDMPTWAAACLQPELLGAVTGQSRSKIGTINPVEALHEDINMYSKRSSGPSISSQKLQDPVTCAVLKFWCQFRTWRARCFAAVPAAAMTAAAILWSNKSSAP